MPFTSYYHQISLSGSTAEELRQGTTALFEAIRKTHALSQEKLRAAVFSAGRELQSYFPARAMRETGYSQLSMLSVVDFTQTNSLAAVVYVEATEPLLALRAAAPIERSAATATEELLCELLSQNQLHLGDCHGLWLSTTAETATHEACQAIPEALTILGYGHELAVPEAPTKILRMLLLARPQKDISHTHVYLRDAKHLRPDLQTRG